MQHFVVLPKYIVYDNACNLHTTYLTRYFINNGNANIFGVFWVQKRNSLGNFRGTLVVFFSVTNTLLHSGILRFDLIQYTVNESY